MDIDVPAAVLGAVAAAALWTVLAKKKRARIQPPPTPAVVPTAATSCSAPVCESPAPVATGTLKSYW